MKTVGQIVSAVGLVGFFVGRFGGQEVFLGPGVSLLGLAALLGSIGGMKNQAGIGRFTNRILGVIIGIWFILGGLNILPVAWSCRDGECRPYYIRPSGERK